MRGLRGGAGGEQRSQRPPGSARRTKEEHGRERQEKSQKLGAEGTTLFEWLEGKRSLGPGGWLLGVREARGPGSEAVRSPLNVLPSSGRLGLTCCCLVCAVRVRVNTVM